MPRRIMHLRRAPVAVPSSCLRFNHFSSSRRNRNPISLLPASQTQRRVPTSHLGLGAFRSRVASLSILPVQNQLRRRHVRSRTVWPPVHPDADPERPRHRELQRLPTFDFLPVRSNRRSGDCRPLLHDRSLGQPERWQRRGAHQIPAAILFFSGSTLDGSFRNPFDISTRILKACGDLT